jgi:hypothetical protein
MRKFSVIEEIHRHRADYADRFNHDCEAMVRDIQERQKKTGWKLVKRSPKPARKLEPVKR